MNIVVIGAMGKKVADLAYKVFDDIKVVQYPNAAEFVDAMAVRNMDFHRMLLGEDGISSDTVSDEVLDDFINIVQVTLPAMKLVTISMAKDMADYLSQIFLGPNYVHFCLDGGSMVNATLIKDMLKLDLNKLTVKYPKLVFKKEIYSDEVELMEAPLAEENSNDVENIPGYVAPPENTKKDKRGFFGKVFGLKPKNAAPLVMEGAAQNIGQGQGVSQFSTPGAYEQLPEDDPFNVPEQQEYEGDVSVYAVSGDDMGLGESIKPETPPENNVFDEDSDNLGGIDDELESKKNDILKNWGNLGDNDIVNKAEEVTEEFNDFPISESIKDALDTNDFEDFPTEEAKDSPFEDVGFNIHGEEEVEEKEEETPSVELPSMNVNLDDIKKKIEGVKVDFKKPERPVMPKQNLETVENSFEDLDFADNLDNMMQSYEESNKKVVEKVVEKEVVKVVHVGGTSTFRNKNGIRSIIVTGDRRIGSTKLALGLASAFAGREKVLYVDMDIYRHGSLGYLDIDNMLEEPEHVQNGITHLKNINSLPNIVHYYKKGRFYTLTSMYGAEVTEKDIETVQGLLPAQVAFSTVIIDCPLELIGHIMDLVRVSGVLICGEDDKVGTINLLNMLNIYSESEKNLALLFEKSYFIVGRKGDVNKFRNVMAESVDFFGLDETAYNWNNIEVIGTLKNKQGIVERIGSES